MSELVPMESREITYDASNGEELWRCNLYLLKKGQLFTTFILITSIVFVVCAGLGIQFPLTDIFTIIAFTLLAPILLSWLMVCKLVSKPRLCTTSISEAGVRDFTDKVNDTKVTWGKVDSVQFDNGSVYFLSRIFTSIYVPSYAFDSHASAQEFYAHAQKLWLEARQSKTQRLASWAEDEQLKIQADTLKQLEQFEIEEEEMWKKLEEEHREDSRSGS
ncbi:hypothetical protein KF913_14890 [Candidatus Obscuribacterales bacterium]|nr:hypothetical protein [Candidatus Obscuribacterales bacterium]